MDNEALKTFIDYFNDDVNQVSYLGSGIGAKEFADYFQNGEFYLGDEPDMLIIKDNTALITEHFEFDCYHVRNKKGSQSRREQFRIHTHLDNIPLTNSGVIHDQINGTPSYINYVQNVSRGFNKHYTKINNYKTNLKNYGLINNNTQVKVMFFIEDTSPLGSLAVERCGPESKANPIILAKCQEFLVQLRNSPEVHYVLACSSVGSCKYIWFIDRNEIELYYQHSIDYGRMDFVKFTPQVVSFRFMIQDNETETSN